MPMTAHPLIDRLQAQAEAFVALRRDLHQHPELGLAEVRTSQLVAERLAAWGYEVHRGLATTGVVGTLRRGRGTKRLGLRADMDALPIHEGSGKPWSSVHAGVMHACGHDGHTAMLLAAAQHLAGQGCFDGTLHLIFQPAEEHPGGAKLMIEQGRSGAACRRNTPARPDAAPRPAASRCEIGRASCRERV